MQEVTPAGAGDNGIKYLIERLMAEILVSYSKRPANFTSQPQSLGCFPCGSCHGVCFKLLIGQTWVSLAELSSGIIPPIPKGKEN